MDPLLINVPEELTTERLTLRAPRAGESAAINAAIVESIEQLQLWMPWATPTPTVEDTEKHSREARARFALRESLNYRLYLKGSDAFVGAGGLLRMDWNVPRFEIGYWVRTSLCGRGYATEFVEGIGAMAFDVLGARRVEIRMDDRNERSWRVAERGGFPLEGILRHDTRTTDGGLRDTRVYARVR